MNEKRNEQYQERVKQVTPNRNLKKEIVFAFFFGGTFSVLGEALKNLYIVWGAQPDTAGVWVSISLIFLGSLLTALGIYDVIGRIAGAGSVVPISGFANSVTAPAIEYRKEGYILGVGARMFTVAGPVLLYGIAASALIGVLYFIFGG